jgi:hypothetical protein
MVRAARIAALLMVCAAAPTRGDDDARALLDRVASAYRDLEHYRDKGRIVLTTSEPSRQTPMTIVLQRPNRLLLDAGAVRLVSDGKTLATWNLVTRTGTERPAPEVIRPATISEGSLGAMLLGGPGGRPAAVVITLLFGEDAPATLLLGGAKPAIEPDGPAEAPPEQVLRIDHVSGPDLLLGIDRKTSLLRWVELTGAEDARARIRWESGEIDTGKAPPEHFAVEPPPGTTRVAPLTEERPAAPAPAP